MHITLEADYAVRIVYCLADAGVRLDAKSIAEKTCVTLRFSLKILRKLVASGIIKSYKGTQGGYEVAKPLGEITLGDVIETVEGPFALSRCLKEDFDCTRSKDAVCKFQRVYNNISCLVKKELQAVNFADLVAQK